MTKEKGDDMSKRLQHVASQKSTKTPVRSKIYSSTNDMAHIMSAKRKKREYDATSSKNHTLITS